MHKDQDQPVQPGQQDQTAAAGQQIRTLAANAAHKAHQNAVALRHGTSQKLAQASSKVQGVLSKADANREQISEQLDTAAKATRVVATVAAAGAAVAAPTGLTALGVSMGLVSAPVIVTAAPVLIGVASGAAALSAGAALYKKYRKRGANKGEA